MLAKSSFGNFMFIFWKYRNLAIVMLILFPSEVLLCDDRCYITLDNYQKVIAVVSDEFLSVSIGINLVKRSDETLFANPRLRKLAAELAPARLRIGGKNSERLIFSKDSNTKPRCENLCPKNYSKSIKTSRSTPQPFIILTAKKWKAINEFCKATKLKLLFSINVLLRDERGWDDQNAIELLEYSREKYQDIDWQLGNEPNSFLRHFNVSLSPLALAQDFKHLRKLLNQHGYSKSLLIGPDISRSKTDSFFLNFLSNGSDYINASSFHHYYLNSRTATLEDFWNPNTMDLLEEILKNRREYTIVYKKIMWLSETSSSFGGGTLHLSDSFAGSPLWVDKLGLAAIYDVKTVVRQTFIGGHYSLVDTQFDPLPDWWISVLYKKLVGKQVLRVNHVCSGFQRIYAHCANRKYTDDLSAVTVFALNLDKTEARFLLNGTAFHDNLSIDEFIITPWSNYRLSKIVFLNGKVLYFDSFMPELKPKVIENSNHILMPPYSIGFWVIRNTLIKTCSANELLYDNYWKFPDF